jgi:outer membrane protein assembly factor BamA
VGPATPLGYTIGGLSGFNATLEARIKVMDNIGVAPFLDVGGAFVGSLPFSGGDEKPESEKGQEGCGERQPAGRGEAEAGHQNGCPMLT